ncbi:ATP-binding protein [Campylobacter mucosalis]|uniref:ATP-binding protein n=1 Tax=Campylobacter mucosalis TaxID=202 RepID=UPI0014706746|nr:ATP-binding protein [Campylobacter mucosalis]
MVSSFGKITKNHKGLKMEVLTKQIVKKLPKNLRLTSIIQEAITNSIHANASQIEVFFETIDESLIEGTNLKVKKVIVCDNGEGFTDENIKSFNQYMSDYKYDLGCKGIGRFTYLTLCDKVEIFSYNKNKPIKLTLHWTRNLLHHKSIVMILKKRQRLFLTTSNTKLSHTI